MDNADRSVIRELNIPHQRIDPLKGYNILKEYGSVMNGTSTLAPRIQEMIKTRYLTGR